MNTLNRLERSLTELISKLFPVKSEILQSIDLILNVDPNKQQFGDLTCNAALILAKATQAQPRAIAQTIVDNFSDPAVKKIEIAGPGFINIFLTQESYAHMAQELMQKSSDFFRKSDAEPTYRYSVEFVSANPTGPLHLGHGRGGIIGDVLARILRFRGHDVTTEFYINDAGAQIKKLGQSFKARCEQQLGIDTQIPEDGYQGEYLIDLAKSCVESFGKELSSKPEEFFAHYAKDALLSKIELTLAKYNIDFDVWFSELTLHETGAITRAIDFLTQRNYIYTKEGAQWFSSTQFGDDKDRVVTRQNGELTYVAADIAYLQNKLARGFEKIIMVLGQDHHSYVARLKAVMQALGQNPDNLQVILYQLVTIKESGEAVRLSKRAGRIVSLEQIIETVGTDVARFFYLNRKADAHLDFDIDLALKHSEENPVYYLQYAYVRTASMLEKAGTLVGLDPIEPADTAFLGAEENFLLKKIISLRDTLKHINRSYHTHMLTYYLLELAHAFHAYYAAHRVINPQDVSKSRARIALVMIVRKTFETCFDLLGISKPDRM